MPTPAIRKTRDWTDERCDKYLEKWRQAPLRRLRDQFEYRIIEQNVKDGTLPERVAHAMRMLYSARVSRGDHLDLRIRHAKAIKPSEEEEVPAGMKVQIEVHKCGGKGGIQHVRTLVPIEDE